MPGSCWRNGAQTQPGAGLKGTKTFKGSPFRALGVGDSLHDSALAFKVLGFCSYVMGDQGCKVRRIAVKRRNTFTCSQGPESENNKPTHIILIHQKRQDP